MYTRITTVHLQSENLTEGIRLFQDSVVPALRQQKGFSSTLLLTNEATTIGRAVTTFESAEAMQAPEAANSFQQQLAKFVPLINGDPNIEMFDTSVYEWRGGAAKAARFVPTQLHPNKIDEARSIFQDSVLPETRQQQGFQGALFLSDNATNRGIFMSLWETEDDLRANEASGYYQAQLAKLAHLFVTEPVREVCAVSVQASAGEMATAGEMAGAAMDNKTIVRRFFEECWNQGNLALINQLVDANAVNHDVGNPGFDGAEGEKRLVAMYRAAFPDTHFTVESLIAEGDMVLCRWIAQGTHQGDLQGIPPTGKRATVPGMTLSRIAGGKIVETWTSWDRLDMLQQLGIASIPESAMLTQQPGMEPPPLH